MQHFEQLDQLQVLSSRLRTIHHEWDRCLAELDEVVEQLVLGIELDKGRKPERSLKVIEATYSVVFGERTCRLGPTIPFRLMSRLARRPNQYFTYDQLIEDVWDGQPRSEDAIRSAIRQLRKYLRAAEMESLAAAIHGQGRCYGLIWVQLDE